MWLLLFLCVLPAHAQDQPRVNITQGTIIGSKATDGDYLTFYGIHYGGSTAGENRFKAPTEPPKYPGDFVAINSEVICAQPSTRGIIGTEDCLVLNIFTKNITTPKPVFVWLESEAYETTTNMLHSYKTLIQEGLLVVTINYRLSIFGFLCLGVPEAPGNAGLKDVIQGLQWIKENIAAFGGDPNNVMLAGHGSGAAMVDLITLSPLSKNLIHKALVLSGSGLASWAVSYDPIGYAQKVGGKMGYTNKSPSELAKLLSTTDLGVLNGVLTDFEFYNNTPLFAPCVENIKLNGSFLHDAPINILRSKNYNDIPYVAGYTDREGTMRAEQVVARNWLTEMQNKFENFIPVDLNFENSEVKTNVSNLIRKFYFAERFINMETIEDFLDYQGDTLVFIPITRGVLARALTSNASVRIFEFAFRNAQNTDWLYPQIPVNGAKHGSIRDYLFNSNPSIHDHSAVTAVIGHIVAFAQTGSPDPNNLIQWLPVQNTLGTLYISGGGVSPNVTAFKEEFYARSNERVDFWDKIIQERYQPPKPVSSARSLVSFGLIVLLTQTLLKLLSMS
ncbi:unnamed protein product, partial [Brenthis ino]